MASECPKCRVVLLEGPTSTEGPIEWACPSCGGVFAEAPAAWQARRSSAMGASLKSHLTEFLAKRGQAQIPVAGESGSLGTPGGRVEDDASGVIRAADAGDAVQQFIAGDLYFQRWQRDRAAPDLDQAERWLRQAADQEEELAYRPLGEIAVAKGQPVEAMRWLRKAFEAGEETEAELEGLRQVVLASAENGSPEAQSEVAEWFFQGPGVPPDTATAAAWLQKAAEQGFPWAIHRLAVLYERGEGVPPDSAAALSLYRRAAEAGQREAQYRLGCMYREGTLLPEDEVEAFRWIEKAAAQEHLDAMVDLAVTRCDTREFAGAVPLLERAAQRGHARAQGNLASLYEWGHGVTKDDERALYWERRAADQGEPLAETVLGHRYRDGRGVERDESQALHWYRRAAFHGEKFATRVELGWLLERRATGGADLQEAAYWFLRVAADEEVARVPRADGQYAFGYMCEFGRGVPQSDTLAFKWYLQAAEAGHSEARARLGALCQVGRGYPGDDWLTAVELLSRAAGVGVPVAAENLDRLKTRDHRAAAYAELLELVGMEEVKETVRRFVAMVSVDHVRRSRGLRVPPMSLHCVFSGPPGTGKTTVARIVGKLLGALGVLTSGHLKEVDRAGLVGRYVGETAQKVSEVVQEALGGVLFIDEAYSLSRSDSPSDYGREAIDTLVKRMEDHRADLVVIVAGYEDEMEAFLRANTGLRSRFPWQFRFSHYSAAQLLQVFQHLVTKDGMHLDPACSQAALALFAKHAGRDRSFDNGRFARTVYEKARVRSAERLSAHGSLTNEQLQTLLKEDLPPDIA